MNHQPIQWFRDFDDRILKGSHDRVSYHAMRKHERTVPLPFLPLDDSVKPLTKSDVRCQLKRYLALFEDPNSVMVCEELRSVVCGTTKLEDWLQSTGMQSGSGRTYNRELFGVPDRMMWVTGVTLFERAKELEDLGMEAIADTFPDFRVNKVDSALNKRYIGPDQPNGCYWQAVRAYT